jgi:hypothetical protein
MSGSFALWLAAAGLPACLFENKKYEALIHK